MPLSQVSVSVTVDVWPPDEVEEDPADVDPSGELALDVAIVPDGAASEEGAMVPDGAPEAEPEGVTALASDALVCPLSPAPAVTAVKEEVKSLTHKCAALKVQEEKQFKWSLQRDCDLCHTEQSMQMMQRCWKHASVIVCECF